MIRVPSTQARLTFANISVGNELFTESLGFTVDSFVLVAIGGAIISSP
jgi:hypothetical protein